MKPGNFLQWYPGDPEDGDLDTVATPPPRRVPACPSDLIAGESIGASPSIFNTRQINRSNQGSVRTDPVNPRWLSDQDESDNGTRVSNPWGSYTRPTPPSGDDDGVEPGMPPLAA
jgi:hypothetical protein